MYNWSNSISLHLDLGAMAPTSFGFVAIVILTILVRCVVNKATINPDGYDDDNYQTHSSKNFFSNLMEYLDIIHGIGGYYSKRMNNAVIWLIMILSVKFQILFYF